MNSSIRCRQPLVHDFTAYARGHEPEQLMFSVSPELNRLLTAAVVSRRFCRLLLTNPLRALNLGYRGEAFQLNPTEIRRVSAIRATSLRDFALQLLMNEMVEEDEEASYIQECQEVPLFVH